MKKNISKWLYYGKIFAIIFFTAGVIASCQKEKNLNDQNNEFVENEQEALSKAQRLEKTAAADAAKEAEQYGFSDAQNRQNSNSNIVEIAVSNPNFSTLVAAVLKTGLAGALSDPAANLTVFAPVNSAFAGLPAPFNNAQNISNITDPGQISFLTNVLLYHVLGTEVFSYQISNGSSSATTLKPLGSSNDNTLYFSKTFGLIRINGQTNVIFANLNANNGVIHVINKVLLFPTQNIAEIAIPNPNLTSLVAALVKTNLAGVFTGSGDFTVFAPTDAAFAQLPAPFNNAANIGNISNSAQIAALSNILRYHVVGSRNFTWDLGIFRRITTLSDGPKNKIKTILGYNTGWVKGDDNNSYASINPGDILATNGVIHVINKVLLPQ